MTDTRVTLPPLCEHYLRSIITLNNKATKTQKAYRLELRLWADYVAKTVKERDCLTASKADIQAYLDHCRVDNGIAAVTARRKLSVLKAFYRWAAEEGHLEASPALAVRLPKLEKKKARALKKHEKERLLRAVLQEPTEAHKAEAWARTWRRDQVMIHVMLFGGLRISEVVGLSWRDVDFEGRTIHVSGKGAKERIIPLHTQSHKVLRELRQFGPTGGGPGDPVFVITANHNPKAIAGQRLSDASARRAVHKYIVRAGLASGITSHKLRHTFATELLEAGADIRDIAEMLGHESLEATKIYTHPTSERHRELLDRLGTN